MNTTDKDTASPQWEREALMKIAQAGLIEQRRARLGCERYPGKKIGSRRFRCRREKIILIYLGFDFF